MEHDLLAYLIDGLAGWMVQLEDAMNRDLQQHWSFHQGSSRLVDSTNNIEHMIPRKITHTDLINVWFHDLDYSN